MRVMVLVATGLLVALTGCAKNERHFGEPMSMKSTKTVDVSQVLHNPQDYDGEYVRVSGEVAEVCEMKGCWLTLSDDDCEDTLFVKFTCPVEGRLIPMEATGKQAVVEGKVTVNTISEDEARHYAEDAGKSEAEIAKIQGPQKQVKIESPSAIVKGLPKDTAAKS